MELMAPRSVARLRRPYPQSNLAAVGPDSRRSVAPAAPPAPTSCSGQRLPAPAAAAGTDNTGGGSSAKRVPFGPAPPGVSSPSSPSYYGTSSGGGGGSSSGGSSASRGKPNWVRSLEENAKYDDEMAKVLEGADGDPDKIRANMRSQMAARNESLLEDGLRQGGVTRLPRVSFRADPAASGDGLATWLWLQFYGPPGERERELLDSVLRSWFVLGRLGGYNAQNMQVWYNADLDRSFAEYRGEEWGSPDNDDGEYDESDPDGYGGGGGGKGGGGAALGSFMHDIADLEFKGNWARVRVDMGTCDELSYDVLINTLYGYSRQYCGLQRVFIGGVNDDWPVPEEEEADVTGGGGDMLGMLQGAAGAGSLGGKRVSMDPMQGPTGLEEELDLLDDLELVDSVEGGSSGGGGSGAAAAAARNERLRQLAGWAEASGRDDVASYSPEDFRRNFPQ